MPPHKTCCLLRNGPQFAQVGVFNRDGKLVSVWRSLLLFKVSVAEPSVEVNAGMAKHFDGRLQLAVCLVGWFLYRQKRLTVNGVVRYFVK